MKRLTAIILLALLSAPVFAQLQANQRPLQKVADAKMVIDDRGSRLGVFPTKRASPTMSETRKQIVHRLFVTDAAAPISPRQLGVVFNHAMQVNGYINGEIAFKMKGNLQPTSGFDADAYPGLARLAKPNVYIVVARTPAEFVEVVRRLQARTDMEWVEPMVVYGPLEAQGLSTGVQH